MIERVKGIIEKKDINAVVINVNGIGIKINMSINGLESIARYWKTYSSFNLS